LSTILVVLSDGDFVSVEAVDVSKANGYLTLKDEFGVQVGHFKPVSWWGWARNGQPIMDDDVASKDRVDAVSLLASVSGEGGDGDEESEEGET
jgi:hypothetical protein